MAKANDESSTIAWIWLHAALMLAKLRFGSVVLAKIRMREWLAAGKLPWSCMSWWGLDADGIARLDQETRASVAGFIILSIDEGDPQFWRPNLEIDWEDNGARQQEFHGARALGIKVSREHLVALLPEEPRERVEEQGQTLPAERKLMEPKVWFDEIRKKHPREQNEGPAAYARRLHALMQSTDVTRVWRFKTLRRRLYDN